MRNVRAATIDARTVSGDIVLEDVRALEVHAEAQAGDVTFDGTLEDGGSYGFFVHSGDVELTLPADASTDVSVSTFDGEFESEFPVLLRKFTGGRAFEFTLGTGLARVQVEVFDGEIRLLQKR
jgi:hypothetical protein